MVTLEAVQARSKNASDEVCNEDVLLLDLAVYTGKFGNDRPSVLFVLFLPSDSNDLAIWNASEFAVARKLSYALATESRLCQNPPPLGEYLHSTLVRWLPSRCRSPLHTNFNNTTQFQPWVCPDLGVTT